MLRLLFQSYDPVSVNFGNPVLLRIVHFHQQDAGLGPCKLFQQRTERLLDQVVAKHQDKITRPDKSFGSSNSVSYTFWFVLV
ncbi:hypothetical protein D3C81_1744000 [compost metagenome]